MALSKFFADLFERTVSTYVQVFLGLVISSGLDVTNLGTLKAAAVAAIPAGLAVIKGLVAKQFGTPDSAGFIDTEKDFGVDDVE